MGEFEKKQGKIEGKSQEHMGNRKLRESWENLLKAWKNLRKSAKIPELFHEKNGKLMENNENWRFLPSFN